MKDSAIRAGVPANTVGLVADPTTVLGTASPTTMDMAGAYATFANRGERVTPTTIRRLLVAAPFEYELNPTKQRAFDTEIADEVNYAPCRRSSLTEPVTRLPGGRPAAGEDRNHGQQQVGLVCWLHTAGCHRSHAGQAGLEGQRHLAVRNWRWRFGSRC